MFFISKESFRHAVEMEVIKRAVEAEEKIEERYRKIYDDIKSKDITVTVPVIDFHALGDVFSVNRTIDGHTEIGHIKNGKVKSWFLKCDNEAYNKLCVSFEKYLGETNEQ